ncbi:MAG: hypothetical protein HQL97_01235 [Magnetococcales bacterium]|nr:hypothetical protein [Magnetococcales bacterium]
MGITLRAYARHRGCAPNAVSKAIATGRISRESDGLIDPVKADAEWERNTNQERAVAQKTVPTPAKNSGLVRAATRTDPAESPVSDRELAEKIQGAPNYQISRAIRETYNAKMARLDYEERQRKLLRAEDVEREAFELGRRVRDRLLNIPSRVAATLAAETDFKTIERLLVQELRTAMEELSQ